MRAALLRCLGLAALLAVSHANAGDAVAVLGHEQVDRVFAANGTLVATSAYKVNASRRDAPGLAEIHAHETDVFYVLQGEATLVTGGRVICPKDTSPGEIRGVAIDGGEVHELSPGDVVVIPAGIPHWFRDVRPPFLYFVVKPISRDQS
jgi:mannose-6-phosphate isomerase-like protein (cupin superfamily)